MNWLDIVLAIPLLWFMIRGFRNGFIIELASLAALILGIFVALHFSFYVEDYLRENFEIGDNYLTIISFLITFAITAVVIIIIGKIIHKLFNFIALGLLNKLAGGVFGLLKAALVLSIILYFINGFDSALIKSEVKERSFLYGPVQSLAPTLMPMLDLDELDFLKEDISAPEII